MGSIIEVFKILLQILPMIKELISIFKGQTPENITAAQQKAIKAARRHCEGVACATELKRE